MPDTICWGQSHSQEHFVIIFASPHMSMVDTTTIIYIALTSVLRITGQAPLKPILAPRQRVIGQSPDENSGEINKSFVFEKIVFE